MFPVRQESPITSLVGWLPILAGGSARGTRLFHDRRLAEVWQSLHPGQALRLKPVEPPPRGQRAFRVDIACDAGRGTLALATADPATLLLASAPDLGKSLRELAASALFGDLAQRVDAAFLPGARAAGLSPLAADEAAGACWSALLCDGHEAARVAALAIAPGIEAALRACAPRCASPTAWRDVMAVPGHVALCERPLAIDLLASLGLGDVLLLPLASLEDARAVLRLAAWGGRAFAGGGYLQDGRFVSSGELRMMDDDPALHGDGHAGSNSLSDLELPVRFELETVSLPLRELEAVSEGYVIEFATPVEEARLRLVSCGHVIGHADLVVVSGRLGARITSLVPRHDADVSDL